MPIDGDARAGADVPGRRGCAGRLGVTVTVACVLTLGPQAVGAMPQRDSSGVDTALVRPRILRATRIDGRSPRIDGRLDEVSWRSDSAGTIATDFVQRYPSPGALALLRTEARVAYDDGAVYVAVRAFDPRPAGIVAPYPRRDDEANCDWVFVEFDSRHDRRTAFSFGVNPRGVQVDGTFSNDVDYDSAWNAVWQAAASRDSMGWTAEFRIPFSQLPFGRTDAGGADPRPQAQVWGLNVYRYSPQHGETSNWSPRLPSLVGVVSRFNELRGIEVPLRVRRLEARPFAVLQAGNPAPARSRRLSAGADLRVGLGSALALTAAIRPDFGQVEADPSEINLSTFETFLTERRPFFVEGADAFRGDIGLSFTTRGDDFGSETAFYSRRVGGAPRAVAASRAGDLLAAVKLSGQSASRWTLGALTAVTAENSAEVRDSTGATSRAQRAPSAVYAVVRAVRDFGGGASALGAFGTFVNRVAPGPEARGLLPRWALSAGLGGRRRSAGDSYEVDGFVMGSAIGGAPAAVARVLEGPGHYLQRGDAGARLDTTSGHASGVAAQARLARVSGSLQWSLTAHAVSPGFEVNDAGFQRNADWLLAVAKVRYRHDRPGPVFLRWAVGSDQIGLGWSFAGERRAASANAVAEFDLRNYWGGTLSVDHEFPALSVEALRGGPALLMPPRTAIRVTLYSDQRGRTQATLNVKGFTEPGTAGFEWAVSPEVATRLSDRLSLGAGVSVDRFVNGWHFAARGSTGGRDRYLLVRLDQTTLAVTARADYALSPNFTLQFFLRPFLGAGRFDAFKEVADPRGRTPAGRVRPLAPSQLTYDPTTRRYAVDLDGDGGADTYSETPDFSRQSLQGSAVLRWEFRPGSELYLVWTQSREGLSPEGDLRPRRDVQRLLGAPPSNVVLVKVSYRWAL